MYRLPPLTKISSKIRDLSDGWLKFTSHRWFGFTDLDRLFFSFDLILLPISKDEQIVSSSNSIRFAISKKKKKSNSLSIKHTDPSLIVSQRQQKPWLKMIITISDKLWHFNSWPYHFLLVRLPHLHPSVSSHDWIHFFGFQLRRRGHAGQLPVYLNLKYACYLTPR